MLAMRAPATPLRLPASKNCAPAPRAWRVAARGPASDRKRTRLAAAAAQRREPLDGTLQPRDASEGSSSPDSTAPLAAGALALLLPLAAPSAALASDQAAAGDSMYWAWVGMGAVAVVSTLLCTSRFLLSYFPGLEKRARARPHTALLRAVTAADPLLDPITKGFFRMTEQGDLNYGAMALLAVVSAVLTTLVGHDGFLVEQVPDLGLLAVLQYLVFVQHMMLLPMWVFVVFRYFLLI